MYILKLKNIKRWIFIQWMSNDMTKLCISYSICSTIYENKHLSCLTFRRAPAKGSNHIMY